MPSIDLVYLTSVFISAALMLGLVLYAWQRRDLPATTAFCCMILGVAEWTLAVGFMGLSDPDGAAPFWHKAITLGICIVPLAGLVFFVQFTGRGRLLTARRILALSVPLIVIQVLMWTNERHGLMFSEVAFTQEGELTVRRETYGRLYWFHSFYGYGLMGSGIVYLIVSAIRARPPFRQQIIVLLLAIFIPLATSISETLQLTHYIIVPFGFAAMGLIMAWSIFQFRFLDLQPIARGLLVDTLTEPIIAVDNQNRIVDVNRATLDLIALATREVRTPSEVIGRSLDELIGPWRDYFKEFQGQADVKSEVQFELAGRRRHFDLRIVPILESADESRGRLIVLREITELKEIQRELRELATTDTLTGTFNRRHFLELAAREVERSTRYQLPLSLVLLDLDRFKQINDQFGHAAGDVVLGEFAELCIGNLREVDIFARYGGEEFALLLPETALARAGEVAERLRAKMAGLSVPYEGSELKITVSMGITELRSNQDTLGGMLRRADRALYQAKAAGRDRVQTMDAPRKTHP